ARYLSVGGGFVVTAGAPNTQVLSAHDRLPHPFRSGKDLLTMCEATGKSIARLMLENELTWRTEAEVRAGLLNIWHVMQA
ncbi:L-serine ammonia-lyase, partial [Acinetobacter baumannii]